MFGLRVRLDPPSSPPSHTQPPPGPPRSRGPLVAPGPGPAGLDRGLRAWQGYFTALSSSSAAGAFAFLASSLVGLTGPGAVEVLNRSKQRKKIKKTLYLSSNGYPCLGRFTSTNDYRYKCVSFQAKLAQVENEELKKSRAPKRLINSMMNEGQFQQVVKYCTSVHVQHTGALQCSRT